MLSTNKSTTLNGQSVIDGEIVMTMYASVPSIGSPSINTTISNKELYSSNIETVNADYAEFMDIVNSLIEVEEI